jgi:nicotinamide-nucleotide adenylyltransferase
MIGRFQPFHNGHIALARQVLADCDELVIVVGSAQYNFIEKDPFTAGERILMIHDALAEAGIDLTKCYIIPVPNDDNNARWLANLRSMVPHFNTLYSGNEFVDHLAFSKEHQEADGRAKVLGTAGPGSRSQNNKADRRN